MPFVAAAIDSLAARVKSGSSGSKVAAKDVFHELHQIAHSLRTEESVRLPARALPLGGRRTATPV